jgi:hypothetical protein
MYPVPFFPARGKDVLVGGSANSAAPAGEALAGVDS